MTTFKSSGKDKRHNVPGAAKNALAWPASDRSSVRSRAFDGRPNEREQHQKQDGCGNSKCSQARRIA